MKIILLKDVGGVGKRNALVEMADGYALNFLIPRGLAVQGTPERIAALKQDQQQEKTTQEARDKKTAAGLKELDGKTIVLKVRSSERGHLFRGLRPDDLVVCIQENLGVHVDCNMISDFPGVIKETGQYKISLSGGGKKSTLTLAVEGGK